MLFVVACGCKVSESLQIVAFQNLFHNQLVYILLCKAALQRSRIFLNVPFEGFKSSFNACLLKGKLFDQSHGFFDVGGLFFEAFDKLFKLFNTARLKSNIETCANKVVEFNLVSRSLKIISIGITICQTRIKRRIINSRIVFEHKLRPLQVVGVLIS